MAVGNGIAAWMSHSLLKLDLFSRPACRDTPPPPLRPHTPLKESQNPCACFTEWISEARAHISVFTALTQPVHTAVMTAALKMTLPIVSL